MLLQMARFPPFHKTKYCDVCRCQVFFDCLSIYGYFGHISVLGVVNSAEVNIGIYFIHISG